MKIISFLNDGTVTATQAEIGDVVGFKNDVEQYGVIIDIKNKKLLIENENGKLWLLPTDCWKEIESLNKETPEKAMAIKNAKEIIVTEPQLTKGENNMPTKTEVKKESQVEDKKETRSAEEVFKYHQEQALAQLKDMKKMITGIEKEFKFEPKGVEWALSNNMRTVKNMILDMTATLHEIGRKDFLYEKHDYKSQIDQQISSFIKEENKTKPLSKEVLAVIDTQKEFLLKATPENFLRLRGVASTYIGKLDRELGERFKNTLHMPKLVEIKKEKAKHVDKTEERTVPTPEKNNKKAKGKGEIERD